MKKILRYIKNKILWHYNLWRAIKIGGNITIDKSCSVNKDAKIYSDGKFLKIGKYTTIHDGAYLRLYSGFISIGENCSINPYCVIYG